MTDVYRSSPQFYNGGSPYSQKFRQEPFDKVRPTNKFNSVGQLGNSAVINPMALIVAIITVIALTGVTIGLAVYFSTKGDELPTATTPIPSPSTILTTLAPTTMAPPTTTTQPPTTQPPTITEEAVLTTTKDQLETTEGPTTPQVTTEATTVGVDTTSAGVTTEVVTTTEEPTTTTPEDVLGTWSDWDEWGDCDVTCGGGIQRRSRECENGTEGFYCLGSATESQRCNTQACPFTVTAGRWLSWSAWTECSVSCGGGAHVRSRACDRGALDLDCVGDDSQTEDCNPWPCPDCTRECTSGTLDTSCTRCECHGEFEGVVQSTAGVALNMVELYHSDIPYEVVYTTGPSGNYSLVKLCVSHEITFQKEGYIAQTYTADWLPNVVQLEQTQSLVMDLHPTSKKRVVGDDVLFCCAAIGNPLPDYYEWFKNDVLIIGESGSTLSLTSVTLDSAGTYHCRASTDSQGVRSTDAILTVKENSDDFCPDSPESKFQQLPSGCMVNGEVVIDVGQCDNIRCRGNSINNQTCGEGQMFCCAATQFETEDIDCEGFTYTVHKTVACGCSECLDPVVDIQGFVFAASDNSPLQNVQIYYNNTLVTSTASNGQFYFTVPEGARTLSITAKSPSRTEYADTTTVVHLEEDADGVFYVSLKLPSVNALPEIDSTTDQTIEINTEGGTNLVDVNVPANSFYDEDGNLYQGQVTPYVSVIDPSDVQQLESAPGDFTTAGTEGDIEQLQTYGMVQLFFYTDDGRKLQITNEVQLEIPACVLGDVDNSNTPGASNPLSAIKLYTFNPNSALWEELASVEAVNSRKRQSSYYTVNITGISSSQPWFNFDAVSRTTCVSKIRIYENEYFFEADQIRRVKLYAFIKGNDDTYSYSTRISYGNNDQNGYCLIHRCDSPRNQGIHVGFTGFLVAEKDGKYLVPAVNNTGLDDLVDTLAYTALEDKIKVNYSLTAVPDSEGPFYDWENKWPYSPTCVDAPISHRHFRFHLHKEDQCYHFQGLQFRDTLNESCKPQFYKSWYSAPEIRTQQYTTCYIRVKIAQYTNDVKVQALSRVGTLQFNSSLESIEPMDVYGFHENCTVGGVVCAKVKPPGERGCSTNPDDDLEDLSTYISMTAWYKDTGLILNASMVNPDLNSTYSVEEFGSTFAFEMTSSASLGGIFCETRDGLSATESDIAAFTSCIEADGDDDFAVQFGTSIDCFGEVILLLNPSIKGSQESPDALEWILEIAEDFPINLENVRVSLTLLGQSNNTLWNLTSQYTSSNEMLYTAMNDLPQDEAKGGRIFLSQSNDTINAILEEARDDVKIIVVVFDYGWQFSQLNTTGLDKEVEYLKVAPYDEKAEEQFRNTNSTSEVDPNLFTLTGNTTAEFISTLKEKLDCNIP